MAVERDHGRLRRLLVALVRDDRLAVPVVVVVGLLVAFGSVFGRRLDSIEQRVLEPSVIVGQLGEHLLLMGCSTALVLVIALPAGVALSRPRFDRVRGAFLAVGGFAQALPPLGVLLLLGFWQFGLRTAIIGLTLASLLPVARNTVAGLQQVDAAIVEAARGMGMSARQTLLRVELPLATPVIVAGVRVALVINVNTATLATYIGAGGLGVLIKQALLLNRSNVLIISGSLVAALALLVDWLAGLAERAVVSRPSGGVGP